MICKKCKKNIKEKYQKCKLMKYGFFTQIYFICNQTKPKYILKKLFNNYRELKICPIINKLSINTSNYICKDNKKNEIIYEYLNLKSLKKCLNLNESTFLKYIKNLIEQLLILKKQGYYYLDISLDNILVGDKIYIIDYESIYHINEISSNLKPVGTIGYVPPEVLENLIYIEKYYPFVLGILILTYYLKYNPLEYRTDYFRKCFVFCNNHIDKEKCLTNKLNQINVNENIKNLIIKSIKFNPIHRINFDEFVKEFNLEVDNRKLVQNLT